MSEPTRDPSGEPGPGATHERPAPSVGTEREADPRGTDDERPIDVAPETGPFEMDAPEAGNPD